MIFGIILYPMLDSATSVSSFVIYFRGHDEVNTLNKNNLNLFLKLIAMLLHKLVFCTDT